MQTAGVESDTVTLFVEELDLLQRLVQTVPDTHRLVETTRGHQGFSNASVHTRDVARMERLAQILEIVLFGFHDVSVDERKLEKLVVLQGAHQGLLSRRHGHVSHFHGIVLDAERAGLLVQLPVFRLLIDRNHTVLAPGDETLAVGQQRLHAVAIRGPFEQDRLQLGPVNDHYITRVSADCDPIIAQPTVRKIVLGLALQQRIRQHLQSRVRELQQFENAVTGDTNEVVVSGTERALIHGSVWCCCCLCSRNELGLLPCPDDQGPIWGAALGHQEL
mmetsp:Transcript_155/g.484  ORF Transcript_155/g.484 Transcript_155/m.484 type:complete len:276 (+) Transcript_155:3121-3948(+)